MIGTLVTAPVLAGGVGDGGAGDVVLAPAFAADYAILDLGAPAGVPAPLGGITFAFDDPDTLLIGGSAANHQGAIYAVGVERETCGRITGFDGAAIPVANAPYIDGGLDYAPGGVLLHTSYDGNTISQFRPGSLNADKVVDLDGLGIAPSTGSLALVPAGFGGAGTLKIVSYDASTWYGAVLVPDGAGTFDITAVAPLDGTIGPGPEGITYVPAAWPGFDTDTVLVAKWDANRVDAYDADPGGDPVPATQRPFISSLFGAEGAATDPVTGDVLFSTLGVVGRVVVVRPIDRCPGDIAPESPGTIDFADLLALLDQWGLACTDADLDRDANVGFNDVLLMILAWGPCKDAIETGRMRGRE
jgi:hypothetical protein